MEREIRVVRLENPIAEKERATSSAHGAPVTTGRARWSLPENARQGSDRIYEADDAVRARARLIERVMRGECSVAEACREGGISRARFYQLRDAYLRHGTDGLRPKPRPGRPDRRLPSSVEESIVAYALLHPAHGERTIAEALSRPELGGLRVSAHGVGGVLRRAGLSRVEARLAVGAPPGADRAGPVEREPGEDDAFSRVYRRYRRYVYSVCLRRLGDQTKAEDATQETFARVYTNLSRFDARHKVRPWVRTIAVNVCANMYHRSARIEARDPADEVWIDRWVLEGPLETVVAKERRERLEQALAALPARQRRALLLHALEGWNYKDIASAEGTSIQAVKSLLFRAREQLRHAREVGVLGLGIPLWRRVHERLFPRNPRRRMAVSRILGSEAIAPGVPVLASFIAAIAMLVSGGVLPHEQPGASGRETYAAASSSDASEPAGKVFPGRNTVRFSGARSARSPSRTSPAHKPLSVEKVSEELFDPTGDATPENSGITSIEPSPAFDQDRTIFAAGFHHCRWEYGCPVLFVTHDGGAHWTQPAAEGLVDRVKDIALLPTYPNDPRIFAIDGVGLKESTDHGASFHLVSPLPLLTRSTRGELAISPRFGAGDSRILMGSRWPRSVVEYRDDDKLTNPIPLPIPPTDDFLEPVFSPDYAADHLILIGGLRPVPGLTKRNASGLPFGWKFVVHRCDQLRCNTITLDGGDGGHEPLIRLSPMFRSDRLGFAVTGTKLFRTRDGARTFTGLDLPPGETNIRDIAIRRSPDRQGSLVVASFLSFGTKGLYKSTDEGTTWTPISAGFPEFGPGFGFGFVRFAGSRGTILAAGVGVGIVCSTDDGETWATHC